MRSHPIRPHLTGLVFGIFLMSLSSRSHAAGIERIRAGTVDPNALTFAEGPATRFGDTVNGRTHQQDPITSFRGWQYVTWFDADRRVCIGRRKLPAGNWEVIRFQDHRFKTNDSHNTAVLGICHGDGTIHMAFDHHASRLNYRVSKPGAAHHPESVRWDASLFSGVLHTLGSVKPEESVTYPRFFNAPDGNLALYYRSVTSANGDGMIEEYNADRQDWMPGLGKFIARDIGVFSSGDLTSRFRCPYLNSISYAGERLHASWVWRDRFEKTHPTNQHDLCYAYSDDQGRTWHNSAGSVIGGTGESFIHLDTPGLVVAPIPTHAGLSSQNTHYAYPDGGIHIMLLRHAKDSLKTVYHHHWRTPEGEWKSEALPFTGNRPKLVGTEDRTLYLIYSAADRVRIIRGVPNSDRSAWQWADVRLPDPPSCYADVVVDTERWKEERILSIYSQEKPSGIIRTSQSNAIDGIPSPLNVIDFRFE